MKEVKTFKSFKDLGSFLLEEQDRIRNDRRPALQRLRYLVPLSVIKAGKKFLALVISTETNVDPLDLLGEILWKACFRGIQTFEWYVAFEIMLKFVTKKSQLDPIKSLKLGILLESSPRGGSWFSNHPALRKGPLANMTRLEPSPGENLLEYIAKETKLQKPKKFTIIRCERIKVEHPKPVELRFIGVGYKDKGNIGYPGSLEIGDVPLLEIDLLALSFDEEREFFFSDLLDMYLKIKKQFKLI